MSITIVIVNLFVRRQKRNPKTSTSKGWYQHYPDCRASTDRKSRIVTLGIMLKKGLSNTRFHKEGIDAGKFNFVISGQQVHQVILLITAPINQNFIEKDGAKE